MTSNHRFAMGLNLKETLKISLSLSWVRCREIGINPDIVWLPNTSWWFLFCKNLSQFRISSFLIWYPSSLIPIFLIILQNFFQSQTFFIPFIYLIMRFSYVLIFNNYFPTFQEAPPRISSTRLELTFSWSIVKYSDSTPSSGLESASLDFFRNPEVKDFSRRYILR